MKIAVTSRNRQAVTGHAGKSRKFWVYATTGAAILDKTPLELPLEQSLHASHGVSHLRAHVNVLISGGMGLQRRIKQKGILPSSPPTPMRIKPSRQGSTAPLAKAPPGPRP